MAVEGLGPEVIGQGLLGGATACRRGGQEHDGSAGRASRAERRRRHAGHSDDASDRDEKRSRQGKDNLTKQGQPNGKTVPLDTWKRCKVQQNDEFGSPEALETALNQQV